MSTKVVSSVTANNGLVVGGTALTATADGNVLIRDAGSLVFRNLDASDISGLAGGGISAITDTATIDLTVTGGTTLSADVKDASITNLKLFGMAIDKAFKGNALAGEDAGDVVDLTQAQATALLNLFTSALRGLVPPSGGGTTNFLRADGAWQAPPASGAATDVQVFLTPGGNTWTKPAGKTYGRAILIGSGAGGGSGRRGAGATGRFGGGGGSGGIYTELFFLLSACNPTETVNVGAGGLGGAAVTADNNNGNPGTNGGFTTFTIAGSFGIQAFGGSAGGGGTSTTGGTGGQGQGGLNDGATGVAGAVALSGLPLSAQTFASGGGGGGGAGFSGTNTQGTASGGGMSGTGYSLGNGGGNTGAGVNGGNGTPGHSQTVQTYVGGGGGGGGGVALGTTGAIGTGGTGGAGGLFGGGGGGGGASVNGNNSGAGGKGGDGVVMIICW